MGRTTRRLFLGSAAGILAIPAIVRPARAADITWRLGHTAPIDFPLHQRLLAAAEEIGTKSNGRLEIQIVPDSQLGSQIGLLSQVRNGSLEMSALTGQILATAQALAGLPMTGFGFSGYDKLWPAMDGELGKTIREQMQLRVGITLLSRIWDFGFRVISTADKPIKSPNDLNGLRIRTPVEAEFVNLFWALQANPIAMSLNEVYPALARHQIDGQEGLLPLIPAARFQDVQKYCALSNHVWDGQWICISANAWKSLPDTLKQVVGAAFDEAALKQRADTADVSAKIQAALTEGGMAFNPVDPAPFRAMLRQSGYYRDLSKRMGERYWDVLEKYTGSLV